MFIDGTRVWGVFFLHFCQQQPQSHWVWQWWPALLMAVNSYFQVTEQTTQAKGHSLRQTPSVFTWHYKQIDKSSRFSLNFAPSAGFVFICPRLWPRWRDGVAQAVANTELNEANVKRMFSHLFTFNLVRNNQTWSLSNSTFSSLFAACCCFCWTSFLFSVRSKQKSGLQAGCLGVWSLTWENYQGIYLW